jgi:hypothetical protein
LVDVKAVVWAVKLVFRSVVLTVFELASWWALMWALLLAFGLDAEWAAAWVPVMVATLALE